MLALKDEFEQLFRSNGIEAICPNVVQTLTEDELIELLPGCDGWIIGDDPATARVVSAGKAGGLRAAVKWGVGVDNIDYPAFESNGVGIAHTPQMFGNEVADIAMGYVIGLARHTFRIDRAVRSGSWLKLQGISLQEKVAGIVGFGDIGRNLATRLVASGMKVQAYDPAVTDASQVGVELLSWPNRVGECDFLILCCSLNTATKHIVNRDSLELCKNGVRIVNVSRGGLIDENSLIAALNSGKVSSCALDVFEVEPIPPSSELLAFEQCVFGAHNASNTIEAARRASNQAIATLLELLQVS